MTSAIPLANFSGLIFIEAQPWPVGKGDWKPLLSQAAVIYQPWNAHGNVLKRREVHRQQETQWRMTVFGRFKVTQNLSL